MLSKTHLKHRWLRSSKDKQKQIQEFNKQNRYHQGFTCFLPIQKIENDLFDYNMKLVFLSRGHISLLEVTNTLAFLESSMKYRNFLTFTYLQSRPSWSAYDNDEHIVVKVHRKILHLIQYGFGCHIQYLTATRKHFKCSGYAFLLRSWSDDDKRIFKHALTSLLRLFGHYKNRVYTMNDNYIPIVRRLPELLSKFGKQWENSLYDHYLEADNPFLMSISAFLCPPEGNDCLYISNEGMHTLSMQLMPPYWIKTFCLEREVHKCNDNTYKMVCGGYGHMYIPFYEFLLSNNCSSNNAFKLFMSVRKKTHGTKPIQLKKINTKRKIDQISRADKKMDNIEKAFGNHCYLNTSGLYRKKDSDMCHMARLILYSEMRGEYKSLSQGYTPSEYLYFKPAEHLLGYIDRVLLSPIPIEPIVQLPKGMKDGEGNTDIPVNMSFPVILLKDNVKKTLSSIMDKDIHNYFN